MEGELVYSTGTGRIKQNNQGIKTNEIVGNGVVRVSRETSGRKGKGVTIISGIAQREHELQALARQLKQRCASGGTVTNGTIEIQGDHRDLIIKLLAEKGINARKSGG